MQLKINEKWKMKNEKWKKFLIKSINDDNECLTKQLNYQ